MWWRGKRARVLLVLGRGGRRGWSFDRLWWRWEVSAFSGRGDVEQLWLGDLADVCWGLEAPLLARVWTSFPPFQDGVVVSFMHSGQLWRSL